MHQQIDRTLLRKSMFLARTSITRPRNLFAASTLLKRTFHSRSYRDYGRFLGVSCLAIVSAVTIPVFLRPQLVRNEAPPATLYTRAQVSQHKTAESGYWVTYGHGVYDITEFAKQHPGGDKILLAAGGPVEPFWHVYTIHASPAVKNILEQYRIGTLDPSEKVEERVIDIQDPFSGDPVRSPVLVVRSLKPFNAETPLPMLADYFLTPNELHYKRNHLPVPNVTNDESAFTVQVQTPYGESVNITVDELKKEFKKCQITATLQCAGNRRQEMKKFGQINGLPWSSGAVGNAEYGGVWLLDVLKSVGWTPELIRSRGYKHVLFDGLDGYGASIPLHKALSQDGDVMLAYEMNGGDLLPDHGFPLRTVVPGHVAARSVKWVNSISLSADESQSHWQQQDYKGFSPSSNWKNIDYSKATSIQEMPVQSAILEPSREFKLDADAEQVTVRGYAWSGGGHGIERVDVSADGGKNWHNADIISNSDQEPNKVWAWCQWEAEIPIQTSEQVELVCKAVDSAYNVQPETSAGIYNLRGVLSNAWDRFPVSRMAADVASQSENRK